jgi:hypothetical protein
MSRYRTQEALTLERILAGSHRYLFCWNGEQGEQAYDCACCITYLTDEILCSCGCACHERIDIMARSASAALWLRALAGMNELPPFFSSEDEKVAHLESQRKTYPHAADCTCDDCQFLGRVRTRKAQETQ